MNRFVQVSFLLLLAALALVIFRSPSHAPSTPTRSATNVAEPTQTKPIHELHHRDNNGVTEYSVRNLIGGPIQVRCTLENAVNTRTDPPLPHSLVVPASGESVVASIMRVDPRGPAASGSLECAAMIGDPRAHPPEGATYALPFPAGTKFRLEQGFGGRFSHNDEASRYALDLGVPEGTAVLAARAGVVMQVEEDFHAHGTDPSYADRANFVRVLHDDGSMALYAHLAPGSRLRQAGDHVVVGQLLGTSGNTGLSTGPHLHFSVQRNAGMALVSIPFAVSGVEPGAAHN